MRFFWTVPLREIALLRCRLQTPMNDPILVRGRDLGGELREPLRWRGDHVQAAVRASHRERAREPGSACWPIVPGRRSTRCSDGSETRGASPLALNRASRSSSLADLVVGELLTILEQHVTTILGR